MDSLEPLAPYPFVNMLRQSNVEQPELSVIMPARNTAPHIREAVESILAQQELRLEMVVIDDHSSDGTLAQVMAVEDPRLTLLSASASGGAGAARNAALACARAPWICPFDSDDVMISGQLAPYFRAVSSDAGTVWGCCGVLLVRADGGSMNRAMGQPFDLVGMLEANSINHGMSLIRRSALQGIGGYNASFRRGQDYAMMLRLTLLGDPLFYDQIGYRYRMRDQSISHSNDYPTSAIHADFEAFLQSQSAHPEWAGRAALLLQIRHMLQAVGRSDWEAVRTLSEPLQVALPDSFELSKYHILGQINTARTKQAAQAVLHVLRRRPSVVSSGLEKLRRQAEEAWLLDQALRLVLVAGCVELLPECLPRALLLQKNAPSPHMERLLGICRQRGYFTD